MEPMQHGPQQQPHPRLYSGHDAPQSKSTDDRVPAENALDPVDRHLYKALPVRTHARQNGADHHDVIVTYIVVYDGEFPLRRSHQCGVPVFIAAVADAARDIRSTGSAFEKDA
jgi:hypothetical protein